METFIVGWCRSADAQSSRFSRIFYYQIRCSFSLCSRWLAANSCSDLMGLYSSDQIKNLAGLLLWRFTGFCRQKFDAKNLTSYSMNIFMFKFIFLVLCFLAFSSINIQHYRQHSRCRTSAEPSCQLRETFYFHTWFLISRGAESIPVNYLSLAQKRLSGRHCWSNHVLRSFFLFFHKIKNLIRGTITQRRIGSPIISTKITFQDVFSRSPLVASPKVRAEMRRSGRMISKLFRVSQKTRSRLCRFVTRVLPRRIFSFKCSNPPISECYLYCKRMIHKTIFLLFLSAIRPAREGENVFQKSHYIDTAN